MKMGFTDWLGMNLRSIIRKRIIFWCQLKLRGKQRKLDRRARYNFSTRTFFDSSSTSPYNPKFWALSDEIWVKFQNFYLSFKKKKTLSVFFPMQIFKIQKLYQSKTYKTFLHLFCYSKVRCEYPAIADSRVIATKTKKLFGTLYIACEKSFRKFFSIYSFWYWHSKWWDYLETEVDHISGSVLTSKFEYKSQLKIFDFN